MPNDMSWMELKELGQDYGSSVTFSRTFQTRDGVYCGVLEYGNQEDMEKAIRELDGRRIVGGEGRLRVYEGADKGIAKAKGKW